MVPMLARQTLLRYHIAFSQLCKGESTVSFNGELMTMLFMAFLVLKNELSVEGLDAILAAEAALKRIITTVRGDSTGALSFGERAAFEAILAEYDRLLKGTPLHKLVSAKAQLRDGYASGSLVNIAVLQGRECESLSANVESNRLHQSIVERVLAE
jgi:hypothetical protein